MGPPLSTSCRDRPNSRPAIGAFDRWTAFPGVRAVLISVALLTGCTRFSGPGVSSTTFGEPCANDHRASTKYGRMTLPQIHRRELRWLWPEEGIVVGLEPRETVHGELRRSCRRSTCSVVRPPCERRAALVHLGTARAAIDVTPSSTRRRQIELGAMPYLAFGGTNGQQ